MSDSDELSRTLELLHDHVRRFSVDAKTLFAEDLPVQENSSDEEAGITFGTDVRVFTGEPRENVSITSPVDFDDNEELRISGEREQLSWDHSADIRIKTKTEVDISKEVDLLQEGASTSQSANDA